MKHILTGTVLAMLMGTTAIAGTTTGKLETYQMDQQKDIYASNFIGMRVYAAEKDYGSLDHNTTVDAKTHQEWDDIGEVNDVILSQDGSVKAVILGVGGFLGIGEKDVAVQMQEVKIVREKDSDDFFLVVDANKKLLTDAEAYDRNASVETDASSDKEMASSDKETKVELSENTQSQPQPDQEMAKSDQEMAASEDTPQSATESDQETAAKESNQHTVHRMVLIAPDVTREGYNTANAEELTTEDLTGARVFSATDEDIGEINRLIVDDQGKIKLVVIDVGGFLGIGEHPIGVTLDEIRILRTEDGDDVRVYIDATQEELEKQPAYEE